MAARCVSIVAGTTLVVLLAACSHSGGSKGVPSTPPATSLQSGAAARTTQRLRIGSVDIERAGDKGALDPATRRDVLATAQRYVDTAILAPLETGALGKGYAALFVPGVRPAATGADRPSLTDLGIGTTSSLNESSTPVALSGLADGSGALLFVATRFNLKITATRAGHALTITRSTELTFERIGSHWLITAYRVKVTRSGPPRPKPSAKPRPKPKPKTTTTRRPKP